MKYIFCGVLNAHLDASVCPLPKDSCGWQHRESRACKFTTEELTPTTFADTVGLPALTSSQISELKQKIVQQLKS